jgi:chemotaxis protein MotB
MRFRAAGEAIPPAEAPLQGNKEDPTMPTVRSVPTLALTTLLVAGFAATGCVPQQKYDELMTAYRGKEQALLASQAELDTARTNERALRQQVVRSTDEMRQLERFRAAASGDIDRLLADYDRLQRQLVELGAGPLPAEVTAALTDLAARYPDVLQFDERRGMLRFSADFTFPPGSTNLSDSAGAALRTFAQILNSEAAQTLEVRVVGHTDNVPIGRPETRARHPTNLHLSAHRAIAVRDALVSSQVAPARFSVIGYGEFRPVVPNTRAGAPENRRVEVYLAPLVVPGDLPVGGSITETVVRVPAEDPAK